jgi:hypothetical protein
MPRAPRGFVQAVTLCSRGYIDAAEIQWEPKERYQNVQSKENCSFQFRNWGAQRIDNV